MRRRPEPTPAATGYLGGAGGHLAALVLDTALGLVLLGVLEAFQAAADALAHGPAGLAPGLGGPLGVGGLAADGGGPGEALGVVGGGVGARLYPVNREPDM